MYIRLISVFTLLLYGFVLSFGQTDPLDDFWKDVERRKNLKKKESQDLAVKYESRILSSCGTRIYIIKQDYVYEKKNKRYVKGDDDYYEQISGVGVSTAEGLVTSIHMLKPWKHDNSLLPSRGYSPVLTNLEAKSFGGIIATKKEEGTYDVNAENGLARYPFLEQEGLVNGEVLPDTAGLLMLFYRNPERDSLRTRIIEYKPKWKEGSADIDTQLMNKQMIGGLFLNVDTTQGKPGFIITGIISGDDVSEFRLIGLTDRLPMKASEKTRKVGEPKRKSAKEEKSNLSGKCKKPITEKAKPADN